MRCTLLCGVHPPVFSPPPGTYASAQSVVITSSTGGATIRYTTDGAAPSDTAGTIYQGPVTIVANTTLKAIACKTGMANSPIVSGAYSLRCATPTLTPDGGTHQSSVQVRISSATTGAAIRYTTDGSTPSASSQRYTAPITLIRSCTVKAVAMLDGCLDSDAAAAVFEVLPGRVIIEGPDQRQEGPLFAGGGTVRVDVYGQGFTGMSGIQVGLRRTDSQGHVEPLLVSTHDGDPEFGGLAVFPNPELTASPFNVFDDSRLCAGFIALDGDFDLPQKTLLLSIVCDYPFDAAIGSQQVTFDPDLTIVAIGPESAPCEVTPGGMSVLGRLQVEGPADRGDSCRLQGGGSFVVNILAERIRNLGGVQAALVFLDSAGAPSPEFAISTTDGDPAFCGLHVSHNSTLFPSISPICDPANGTVGFVTQGENADLPEPSRLLSIVYNYTGNAATGTYSIVFNGDHTFAACQSGHIPFQPIEGSIVIRNAWPIPGDANSDCTVNILDLIYVRNALNQNPESGNNCMADINRDGRINILDLILIRGRLGARCQ